MLKCYVCGKEITPKQQKSNQFYYIGTKNGEEMARHKKCSKEIIKKYLKRMKTRKTWSINPKTRCKPAIKKERRAKDRQRNRIEKEMNDE